MAAIISITATTQPTTMPVIQPAEHPTDCARFTFTVVSGLLCMVLESDVSISVVVSGTVVVINTVVAGSENEIHHEHLLIQCT